MHLDRLHDKLLEEYGKNKDKPQKKQTKNKTEMNKLEVNYGF